MPRKPVVDSWSLEPFDIRGRNPSWTEQCPSPAIPAVGSKWCKNEYPPDCYVQSCIGEKFSVTSRVRVSGPVCFWPRNGSRIKVETAALSEERTEEERLDDRLFPFKRRSIWTPYRRGRYLPLAMLPLLTAVLRGLTGLELTGSRAIAAGTSLLKSFEGTEGLLLLSMIAEAQENSKSRKRVKLPDMPARRCGYCGARSTVQWRSGPKDIPILCNACGVKYRKGKLHPKDTAGLFHQTCSDRS